MAEKKPTLKEQVEELTKFVEAQKIRVEQLEGVVDGVIDETGALQSNPLTDSGKYRRAFAVTVVSCMNCQHVIQNQTTMFLFSDNEIEEFADAVHQTYTRQNAVLCGAPKLIVWTMPVLVNDAYMTEQEQKLATQQEQELNAIAEGSRAH